MDVERRSEQAIALIREARNIVALTGAGISTEAGIPDFRSPGGLWEDAEKLDLFSLSGFRRSPESFYRASSDLITAISRAEPTSAHRLLARLEEMGRLKAVATQNIDGLHTAAGSRAVYELHGTYRTGRCTQCSKAYEMAGFYAEVADGRLTMPLCSVCTAPIKPDIVFFEENLPEEVWEKSVAAAYACDLMLVFGSSLVVYPAAELPMMAIAGGAKLVIVNMEPTGHDSLAAAAIHGKLGDFARIAAARIFEQR
jgi:NAD-dependent deacetylase